MFAPHAFDVTNETRRPAPASFRKFNKSIEQQLQASAQARIDGLKDVRPKVDVTLSSLHDTLRSAHEEARLAELTGARRLEAEAAASLAIAKATAARTDFEMRRSLVERQAELAHTVEARHALEKRATKRAMKTIKAIQVSAEPRTDAHEPVQRAAHLEELRQIRNEKVKAELRQQRDARRLVKVSAKAAPKVETSLGESVYELRDQQNQRSVEQRRAEQAAVKATGLLVQDINKKAAPRTEVALSSAHDQARDEHAARAARKRAAERKEFKAHRKMLDAIKATQPKVFTEQGTQGERDDEAVAIRKAAVAIQSARRRSVARHHIKLIRSGAAQLTERKQGQRIEQRRNALTGDGAWHVSELVNTGILAAAA